jgi:hypothetical protein
VVASLGDSHSYVRWAALDVLQSQTQLPQQMLEGAVARLGDDNSDVRWAALHVLKNQSQLQLQRLVHHANHFVNRMLRESFSENIYWIVRDNTSKLTVGSKSIDIQGDNGELMIFSEAVREFLLK